jgi:hypothetical protein
MSGFAKGRLDSEGISDRHRRDQTGREVTLLHFPPAQWRSDAMPVGCSAFISPPFACPSRSSILDHPSSTH